MGNKNKQLGNENKHLGKQTKHFYKKWFIKIKDYYLFTDFNKDRNNFILILWWLFALNNQLSKIFQASFFIEKIFVKNIFTFFCQRNPRHNYWSFILIS